MLGKMTPEVIDCLEGRADAGDEVRDSLLLLAVNAFSKGDKETWEGYAVRVLEVAIDRGYTAVQDLREHFVFSPIRKRDDFRRLLERMETN